MDKNYYLEEKIGNSGVAQTRPLPSIAEDNRKNLQGFSVPEDSFMGNAGSFYGTQEYRNSERSGEVSQLVNEGLNVEESFAREQAGIAQLANGLVNNLAIFGSSALGGTVGFVYGLFDSLANADLSKLWDNPVNRGVYEFQKQVAEEFPIYREKGYSESSIWKKLGTTTFWGNRIQNLGYTEGMLVPGMAVSSALSKTSRVVQLIGSSLTGAMNEASIEAIQAKDDKTRLEIQQAIDSYNQMREYVNTPEEESILYDELANTIKDIEDDGVRVGNAVMGENVAYLLGSNMIGWGNILIRGSLPTRRTLLQKQRASGITRDGLTFSAESPAVSTVKSAGKILGKATTEGMEEVAQDIIVRAADLNPNYNSFNESQFNTEPRELAANTIQAFGLALSQAMKDPETAELFMSGFMTSITGSPILRSPKNNNKWRSPITMEGGVSEFLDDRRAADKKRRVVNEINRRTSSPEFQEYYKGLVRSNSLQQKANEALEINDDFNYKNYTNSKLISDVIMFDNIGHLDMLEDIVNKASNLSDEDIQELIRETSSNGSGPFMDNGNPLSVNAVRYKINENASKVQKAIDEYRKDKEVIEASLGTELSKDAMESMLYAKAQIRDWNQRRDQIESELNKYYRAIPEKDRIISEDGSWDIEEVAKTLDKFMGSDNTMFTPDEKENILNKVKDLAKIEKAKTSFYKKFEEYWNNPQKANENEKKIKDKAIKKETDKKKNNVKNSLSTAATPQEFRQAAERAEASGNAETARAVNELIEENNPVAVENDRIQKFTQGVIGNLSKMDIPDQMKSDAIDMITKASESASTLEDAIAPENPYLSQEDLFYSADNPRSGNDQGDTMRFLETQVALSNAIDKQLKEDNMNVRSSVFTMKEVTPTPGPGIEDNKGDGSSGGVTVRTAPEETGIVDTPEGPVVDSSKFPANEIVDPSTPSLSLNSQGKVTSGPIKIEEVPIEDSVPQQTPERQYNFWQSSMSKYLIPAKENKQDRKFIRMGDTQAVRDYLGDQSYTDYSKEYNYLDSHNAFDYVDNGNISKGDKIFLGIDPAFNDSQVFLFTSADDGYQVVGILNESDKYPGLNKAIEYVRNQYNKSGNTGLFISDLSTTVFRVTEGDLVYGNQKNLHTLTDDAVLVTIANSTIESGEYQGKNSDFMRPLDIGSKNGMVYIAIPNAKKGQGKYSLAGLKVRRFSPSDMSIEEISVTPVGKKLINTVSSIASVSTPRQLADALKQLSEVLHTRGLRAFINNTGDGINFSRVVYDSNNRPVMTEVQQNDGSVRTDEKTEHIGTIFFTNKGEPRPVSNVTSDILNLLYNQNFRFQVNKNRLNSAGYNKDLISSNIFLTNLASLYTEGARLLMEPITERPVEVHEDSTENILEGTPEKYFDSESNTVEEIPMVDGGEILGVPIKIFAVPRYTSYGRETPAFTGYSYGIKFPNNQVWIDSGSNPQTDVETIKSILKQKFEGPASKYNPQNRINTAAKQFKRLAEKPVVSIEPQQKTRSTEIDFDAIDADVFGKENPRYKTSDTVHSNIDQRILASYGIEKGVKYSITDFLDKIKSTFKPGIPVNLRDSIIKIASTQSIEVKVDDGGPGELGRYFNGVVTMNIDPSDSGFSDTLMHEIIHSITLGVLKSPDNILSEEQVKAKEILYDVFHRIEAMPEARDYYGITNIEEFTAELSNPEFRDFLKSIKINQKETFWSRIIDALKRIFSDVLEVSDAAFENLISGNMYIDRTYDNTIITLPIFTELNNRGYFSGNKSLKMTRYGKLGYGYSESGDKFILFTEKEGGVYYPIEIFDANDYRVKAAFSSYKNPDDIINYIMSSSTIHKGYPKMGDSDIQAFKNAGFSEKWIEESTADEKRIAKVCIGI